MSAITAEATAADLPAELVDRDDGAATLDDVRELLDGVTAKLRRAVRAVKSMSRRAGRLATAVRTALARLGGAS
jgi:signal transduction histidine kinase